jgi:hypothetical protein
MDDPTKTRPYFCHMPLAKIFKPEKVGKYAPNVASPAVHDYCSVDADCPTGSYCDNDPSKQPVDVWNCHSATEPNKLCHGDSDCDIAAGDYCNTGHPPMEKYICH